jgi:type II secretory pathway predicted ATPase ExeA
LDIFSTYDKQFGLSGHPFNATPDPSFFFESRAHGRAYAHLRHAMQDGDCFMVLTGDAGTGKTVLLRKLVTGLEGTGIVAAMPNATALDRERVLFGLVTAFRAPIGDASLESLRGRLRSFLTALARLGRRGLAIIDEAQHLHREALDELIDLARPQADGTPSLQILLAGQARLRTNLPDAVRELREPTFLFCDIGALSEAETRAYVEHRLRRVDWQGTPSFDPAAHQRIFALSGGVAREINRLCHRVLMAAAQRGLSDIGGDLVDAAHAAFRAELGVLDTGGDSLGATNAMPDIELAVVRRRTRETPPAGAGPAAAEAAAAPRTTASPAPALAPTASTGAAPAASATAPSAESGDASPTGLGSPLAHPRDVASIERNAQQGTIASLFMRAAERVGREISGSEMSRGLARASAVRSSTASPATEPAGVDASAAGLSASTAVSESPPPEAPSALDGLPAESGPPSAVADTPGPVATSRTPTVDAATGAAELPPEDAARVAETFVKAPVVETPVAEAPVAETPVGKTPAVAETPAVEETPPVATPVPQTVADAPVEKEAVEEADVTQTRIDAIVARPAARETAPSRAVASGTRVDSLHGDSEPPLRGPPPALSSAPQSAADGKIEPTLDRPADPTMSALALPPEPKLSVPDAVEQGPRGLRDAAKTPTIALEHLPDPTGAYAVPETGIRRSGAGWLAPAVAVLASGLFLGWMLYDELRAPAPTAAASRQDIDDESHDAPVDANPPAPAADPKRQQTAAGAGRPPAPPAEDSATKPPAAALASSVLARTSKDADTAQSATTPAAPAENGMPAPERPAAAPSSPSIPASGASAPVTTAEGRGGSAAHYPSATRPRSGYSTRRYVSASGTSQAGSAKGAAHRSWTRSTGASGGMRQSANSARARGAPPNVRHVERTPAPAGRPCTPAVVALGLCERDAGP